jgi:competence protein ComGC
MSKTNNSDKRERTTTEFILVIILLGVLMQLFVGYYFTQEKNIANAGFKTLAQNFKNTIVVVHAQWLMDKQPSVVVLSSLNSQEKVSISVNKKGWLDSEKNVQMKYSTSACENIWQLAMNIPMSLMKLPIAAVEIHDETLSDYHQCQYVLSTGEYFVYTSGTGKVTQVVINE